MSLNQSNLQVFDLNLRIYAALAIVAVIGLVVLFGDISTQPQQAPDAEKRDTIQLVNTVRAQVSKAKAVQQEITINGETEAGRQVTLRSEGEGRVTKLHKRAGEPVAAGELILELDAKALPDHLKHAQALVTQRQLEFEGAQRLKGQGLLAQAKMAEASALLEAAKAEVSELQQQLDDTRITAPFDGILDTRHVEIGELVRKGEALVDLVDFQPFIVTGEVNEQEAGRLTSGMPGSVELINGDSYSGTLRFLSKIANPQTRTFELELEIDNPSNRAVPSGMTAKMILQAGAVQAHKVSPALFELNDEGQLGLKRLDSENRVIFEPINIVKAETGAVWVTGLPDPTNLITVGHGYVSEGDIVTPEFVDEQDMTALAESQHGG